MRFVSLSILCLSLTACGTSSQDKRSTDFQYKHSTEMDDQDRQKLEIQAAQACTEQGKPTKSCLQTYINERDKNINIRRMNQSVSYKLWNQMNYQERQWVYAQQQQQCGGVNQACINANLQARDASIMREEEARREIMMNIKEQEAASAAFYQSISQGVQSLSNQLQQQTAAVRQQANYGSAYNQANAFSATNNAYYKPKITCVTSGNILQCR